MYLLAEVPYIRHGPNTIPDSVFIMAYLHNTYGEGKTSGILAPMDAAKNARVEACMALVDQTLPFAVGYYRIIDCEVRLAPSPPDHIKLLLVLTSICTCRVGATASITCRVGAPWDNLAAYNQDLP